MNYGYINIKGLAVKDLGKIMKKLTGLLTNFP